MGELTASERAERDEYIAGRLLDRDEEAGWRSAQRDCDLGLERGDVPTGEMIARWAADRAQVESDWDQRRAVEYGRLRWVAQLALDREAEREAEDAA